ncbi:MAG: hypothetical protein EAZ89_05665 [Bacteroidetes bacterium]|nr:MAG: hypothetical protein EAZ89_05665 [Bacteroidota bacterium]
MKVYQVILLLTIVCLLFPSCMVNLHTVGNGPVGKQQTTEVYDRKKQVYLFWGLMPMNEASPRVPSHGDYQLKSSITILDGLAFSITGGLFSMRTVEVRVKEDMGGRNP